MKKKKKKVDKEKKVPKTKTPAVLLKRPASRSQNASPSSSGTKPPTSSVSVTRAPVRSPAKTLTPPDAPGDRTHERAAVSGQAFVAPEQWFPGDMADNAALEKEITSIPLGAVIELKVFDTADGRAITKGNPVIWFGSIAGIVVRMEAADSHGVEMIMRDTVGSTPSVQALVDSEHSKNGSHLRVHLCGYPEDECE